jgi:hypothetical protein
MRLKDNARAGVSDHGLAVGVSGESLEALGRDPETACSLAAPAGEGLRSLWSGINIFFTAASYFISQGRLIRLALDISEMIQRPVDPISLTDYSAKVFETPFMAVVAFVTVVSHHKEFIGRHGDRPIDTSVK